MARDGFTKDTLRKIAGRAGYICSFPGCERLTVGPSEDRQSAVSMTGVAAHITGASPVGERYDANLTRAQRAAHSNGIWMCQVHGKWIDDNPSAATVTVLRQWKATHESAIAQRVAHGRAVRRDGITSVTLTHVGIFARMPNVALGRLNVVYGRNASGKSTFAQALAAFSGGAPLARFIERFGVRDLRARPVQVTATAREGDLTVTVTLARAEAEQHGRDRQQRPGRLHVEVDGAVAIDWPRGRFRMVLLDDLFARRAQGVPAFEALLVHIAHAFGMDIEDLADGLRPELFATSPLGYGFRRRGGEFEVHTDEGPTYQHVETLSGGEMQLAAAEIVLRLARARREQNWLLILDSEFFLRLDEHGRQQLIDTLLANDPGLQLVICVNERDQATALESHSAATWIGASQAGRLTIHSYN